MATASVNIPPSDKTVQVSAINTTLMSKFGFDLVHEPRIGNFEFMNDVPSLSFVIQHENVSGQTENYIFDLGVRKDLENCPPYVQNFLQMFKWEIPVETDVAAVLKDHGWDLNSVHGVIWSHHHFDHVGDPKTFPPTTSLTVGSGFKREFVPGYPTNPQAPVSEDAWEGRNLKELDFSPENHNYLKIGAFDAVDFFEDGSFYLLDAPGHTVGHLAALARTTPDTFVLLGADICHHNSAFRPSRRVPLPDEILPNPLADPGSHEYTSPCPCEVFVQLHPEKRRDVPFSVHKSGPNGPNHDREAAIETRDKLMEMDAADNVLTLIAHDKSLLDVIDFFPDTLNDWREKGWKKAGFWRFLRDFGGN